eukprot:COSAG02_NODE_11367_length_1739_cov_1.812195_1_plen_174_part_10
MQPRTRIGAVRLLRLGGHRLPTLQQQQYSMHLLTNLGQLVLLVCASAAPHSHSNAAESNPKPPCTDWPQSCPGTVPRAPYKQTWQMNLSTIIQPCNNTVSSSQSGCKLRSVPICRVTCPSVCRCRTTLTALPWSAQGFLDPATTKGWGIVDFGGCPWPVWMFVEEPSVSERMLM